MADIPYMPLYVNDFEGDTAHLTIEEDGAYNRLLRLCWRTSGCSLPNDHEWIRRKLRVTDKQYNEIVKPIISEYFKDKKGRIFQERLQKEFDRISQTILSRKKAGKKGGTAKALNNKKKTFSKNSVLPLAKSKQSPSIHTHNQSHKEEEKIIQKEFEDLFDVFWGFFPKRKGSNPKNVAKTKFLSLCKKVDPLIIIEGAKKYANQEVENVGSGYIAQAITWLNQERWDDDYYTPQNQKPKLSEDLSDWQDEQQGTML